MAEEQASGGVDYHDDDDDHVPIIDEEAPADDLLSPLPGAGAAGEPPIGSAFLRPPQAPATERIPAAAAAEPPSAPTPSSATLPAAAPAPAAAPEKPKPVTSSDQITIGTVLDDKYQIRIKLGQGGMGAVYRAKHILLDKDVALKVINSNMAQDPNFKARFFREAKVAMEFVHRHAVPVRDFGQTQGGIFYMTMDYSSGRSLRDLVEKEGSLEPARAARIVCQALEALAESHRKKIIHRDLKPDNVMVEKDQDGRDFVKVLDFGLAKIATGEEEAHGPSLSSGEAILGTPAYMAPEQAAGEEVDHRADLYACGIILFQLLTGDLPFKALTTRQMILKQVSAAPPPLRQVKPDLKLPEGLEAVVMHALAKERDARYQDANEFLEALAEFTGASESRRFRRAQSGDTVGMPAPSPQKPPSGDRSGAAGTEGALEIAAGAVVDRYKILEKIAEGGFGAVWRAEHVLMHRLCAFKVMKPGLSMDEEFATRFQREAQVASKFKHPNAVEVYDFGKIGQQLFMAMELVEGKPLGKRMKGQGAPIGVRDAVEIMCQVLEVLEAAHRVGIVHRDLKPDNIMVRDIEGWPNQVKVLDFGIAKMKGMGEAAGYQTKQGDFFGTPQYSSPEQCKGEKTLDGKSDLYSCGVILFEMLTGKLPYESETAAGFLAAHMVSPPKRVRDVRPDLKLSEALEGVIIKALEKQRDKRFQSAREFEDALKRATGISPVFEISEHGVRVSGEGRAGRMAPPRATAPVKGFAIGVFALAAAIVAAVFYFGSGPPKNVRGRLVIQTSPGGVGVMLTSSVAGAENINIETAADGVRELGDLVPGTYGAIFRKLGFMEQQQTIDVKAGESIRVEVTLEPPPEAQAAAEMAREQAEAARAGALKAGADPTSPELRAAEHALAEGSQLLEAGELDGARGAFETARAAFEGAGTAARQLAEGALAAAQALRDAEAARGEAEIAGGRELARETMRRADEEMALGGKAAEAHDVAEAQKRFRSALALFGQARDLAAAEANTRLAADRTACEEAERAASAAGAPRRAAELWAQGERRRAEAQALERAGKKVAAAAAYRDAKAGYDEAKMAVEDGAAVAAFAARMQARLQELGRESQGAREARAAAAAAKAESLAGTQWRDALQRAAAADRADAAARALVKGGAERVPPKARPEVRVALDAAIAERRKEAEAFRLAEMAARRAAE